MRRERGNILFLILLAIVLFVALNYAVMGQREQSSPTMSAEQANTMAAQLIQNASLIENSIMRAMTVDGVPDYGFDFSGTGSNSTANATCVSGTCKMFLGKGGAVQPLLIPIKFSVDITGSQTYLKADFWVEEIINVGTSAPDLVIRYRALRKEVCEAINRLAGNTDMVTIASEQWDSYGDYTGTLTSFPPSFGQLGDSWAAIKGKRTFCMNHTHGYTFVHVLLAR